MNTASKCRFGASLIVALCGFAFATSLPAAQPAKIAPEERPFHPTRVLVKFVAREPSAIQTAAAIQPEGLRIQRQFRLLPGVAVLDVADENTVGTATALTPAEQSKHLWQRSAAIETTGLFEYVEPDFIRTINAEPTDSVFTDGTLWALRNTGQNGGTIGADIGAVAAWDITTGSTKVIAAVLETGIRYTHQDLVLNCTDSR